MMRLLIIEDEPRAARQLQRLLDVCAISYELLGILDSIESTVAWFKDNEAPDLTFMDIQLADGLSFEIFQKVQITSPIIFTTAFDQYAIQAFKVNSIDYLLKPIQQVELQDAIRKYQSLNSKGPDQEILKNLLSQIQKPQYRAGLLVKDGSGFIQIKIADVNYFYSSDSITFAVVGPKRYIIDETLDQLYDSLDPQLFFRINRGQIISKSSIQRIDAYFNHRVKLSVTRPRDQEFIVSRGKTPDFKNWMNQ